MRVRAKPTIHVTVTPQTLAMLDAMAGEDAPPGAKADRSRLIGQMTGREYARREAEKGREIRLCRPFENRTHEPRPDDTRS